jgi:hypothetical protein
MKFAYKTVGSKIRANKVISGISGVDLRVSDFREMFVGFRRIDWIELA